MDIPWDLFRRYRNNVAETEPYGAAAFSRVGAVSAADLTLTFNMDIELKSDTN
jgi:hypothetical protein